MNTTTINSDSVCVYMRTKVKISASFKKFLKIVGFSFTLGLLIISIESDNPGLYQFGIILTLAALVLILPITRTLLWNLFGEEYLSFSSKSVVQQLNYGIVILPSETYLFNGRLNYKFENMRIVNDTEEVQIHFFSYDEMDQPVYLFETKAYLSVALAESLIRELQKKFDYTLEVSTGFL